MVKVAKPEFNIFNFVGNCAVQKQEKLGHSYSAESTYPSTIYNYISQELHPACGKGPRPHPGENDFWTGKWSVIVRFNKDALAEDGVQHLL